MSEESWECQDREQSTPAEDDELALAIGIRRGDHAAFQRLFMRYSAALCEMAFSYVKRDDVASELVQDVFSRVWDQRDTIAIQRNARAYLYTATRHRALNYLKHQRVTDQLARTNFVPGEHPGIGTPIPQPDEQLVQAERVRLIESSIDSLPERQRAVLQLRWHHHLSYAEIAAVLGLTIKGVESARARAIETLRSTLQGVFPE